MVNPESPFINLVGIEVTEQADGRCSATLPHRPDLFNGNGRVHGGAVSTLIDTTCARAVESLLNPGGWCATVELKVNFLAAPAGDLTCTARIISRSRRLAVLEADVTDSGTGTLVAKALGTFAVRQG